MKRFDKFILSIFQRLTDDIQNNIGVSSFMISKLFLILWVIFEVIDCILSTKIMIIPFITFIHPIVLYILYKMYKFFLKLSRVTNDNPQFKNILSEHLYFLRLVMLYFLVINVGYKFSPHEIADLNDASMEGLISIRNIIHTLGNFFEVFFLYFVSCTSKPKKPSRLKKFITKLKSSFSKSPSPAFN